MENLELNPDTLSAYPQIGAVELLERALEVTAQSLMAAHRLDTDPLDSPREDVLCAFTAAILNQIEALEATLLCYEGELAYARRLLATDIAKSAADIPW